MKFSYVIAIVPPETVDALERRLRSIGIGGLTLTKVSAHTKLEIFVEASHLEGLLNALLEVAGSDVPGAGIAAVMPVEKFLHLRTGTEFLPAPSV